MRDRIGKHEFAKMFDEAAKRIRQKHGVLTELDSFVGDGDHGTTMLRVAAKMELATQAVDAQTPATLLRNLGWDVLSVDGGASSAILGTFFSGMGEAKVGDELDCGAMAATFEAGLTAVSQRTKAMPGDKTMMDALVPAVHALRAAASSGTTVPAALHDAAVAAWSGAESTKQLIAKYGRAKFLGEKTLGHMDAGAYSIALLFAGFSGALTPNEIESYAQ